MIPPFNARGFLPPHIAGPLALEGRSPYPATLNEVYERYVHSPVRLCLFDGFLRYRRALNEFGFTHGVQWMDGSFIEDIERTEARSPRDIDVVTFAWRPERLTSDGDYWDAVDERRDLFEPEQAKAMYRCDAYCIEIDTRPLWLLRQAAYWNGLLSHRRRSMGWKGFLELNLSESADPLLAVIKDRL